MPVASIVPGGIEINEPAGNRGAGRRLQSYRGELKYAPAQAEYSCLLASIVPGELKFFSKLNKLKADRVSIVPGELK